VNDITAPPRLPTGASSRVQSFSSGQAGDPGDIATSAGQDSQLNLNAQQFAAQVPDRVIQTSTLQSPMPSANGLSAQDAERMLPGGQPGRPIMLPTQNASSPDSWQKSIYMNLQGEDQI
jgi:hypothetical protein